MTPDTISPKGTPEPVLAARLAALLSLPEGTGIEDVLAMIAARLATPAKMAGDTGPAMAAEMSPDPARFVPVAAMQALLAERTTCIATARETEGPGESRTRDAGRAYHERDEVLGFGALQARPRQL